MYICSQHHCKQDIEEWGVNFVIERGTHAQEREKFVLIRFVMRSSDLVVVFHCCEKKSVCPSGKANEEEEEDYCATNKRHQTFVHRGNERGGKKREGGPAYLESKIIISIDNGRNSNGPDASFQGRTTHPIIRSVDHTHTTAAAAAHIWAKKSVKELLAVHLLRLLVDGSEVFSRGHHSLIAVRHVRLATIRSRRRRRRIVVE